MAAYTYNELSVEFARQIQNGKDVTAVMNNVIEMAKDADNSVSGPALTLLGDLYWEGAGFSKDQNQAMQLYQMAAKVGCADAAAKMTAIYTKALDSDIPADIEKGMEYAVIAAELGHVASMNLLVEFYQNGYGGIKKNFQKAEKYAKMAVAAGDKKALANLAKLYSYGDDTKMESMDLYREYLQYYPNDAECMGSFAWSLVDYAMGKVDFHANYDYAISLMKEGYYWAEKGSESGDAFSNFVLGYYFYLNGVPDILKEDQEKAYQHIKYAADNGHVLSEDVLQNFKKNFWGKHVYID